MFWPGGKPPVVGGSGRSTGAITCFVTVAVVPNLCESVSDKKVFMYTNDGKIEIQFKTYPNSCVNAKCVQPFWFQALRFIDFAISGRIGNEHNFSWNVKLN